MLKLVYAFSEPTIETQQATGFIKDAEKCKLLLSSLHETTARRDETCPITMKLQQISTDLESFLIDHISTSVNSMLATAQEMCPNVVQHNSKSLQDLQVLSDSKSRIPKDFVKNLVNDTIGVEVYNKVNEMNLILANHISDKVIDDVIDNLSRTYKGLVGDLGSMKKKRSLTPDVLKVNSQNKYFYETSNLIFRDLVNDLIAKVKVTLSHRQVITIVKNPPLLQFPRLISPKESQSMIEN